MIYVYLLPSRRFPAMRYVGSTRNLNRRVEEHNSGKSPHTARGAPWDVIVAVRFAELERGIAFERYLKSGSGHAFAKRHLW